MPTLIIDNHDSFTWNLVHLVASLTGEMPVVMPNNQPDWHMDQLSRFDQVILSPGPGHPGRVQDFGLCRQIIDNATLPILGVCLGYQGICLAAGADITSAPVPKHGLVSQVTHAGTGLFAGIPAPFAVVRYHSLRVSGDLSQLEILAHAEDGVIMAARHRTKPQFGVQFHPESIASTYGPQILKNFMDLSQSNRNIRAPFGTLPAIKKPPQDRQTPTLKVKILPLWVAPEACFEAFYKDSTYAFWLDSSNDQGFSFMGDHRGPHALTATFCGAASRVTICQDGETKTVESGFFDWLDQQIQSYDRITPDLPVPFTAGWVGYLGYGLKAEAGGELGAPPETPDAAMMFADRLLAFDHARRQVHLIALVTPQTAGAGVAWLEDMAARLPQVKLAPVSKPKLAVLASEITLRHEKASYLRLIADCQKALKQGESYEICLTNLLSGPALPDPLQAYQWLRCHHKVSFGAFLRWGDISILSCSPERFLKISASGVVESKPIKGTRPRHHESGMDQKLAEELRDSEKDRAENLMIVDLVRNDLGRCAQLGSVEVPNLFAIESYSTVHQMVSTIRAQLRPECSVVECVRAAFPGGSMTGAPKLRTMQILDHLEHAARGIYSGSIGYFSLSGAVDLNIVIRTFVATKAKTTYGIGGAVTILSSPEDEFEEIKVKSVPFLSLFNVTFPGGDAS